MTEEIKGEKGKQLKKSEFTACAMRAFKNNVFKRGENPIVEVEEKIKMKKTESEKRKTQKIRLIVF